MGTQTEIHEPQFKDLILTNMFLLSIRIRKGRDSMKLTFLSQPGTTEIRRVNFGRNSHPLLASASFPTIPSAGSGVSGVSQVLFWWPEIAEEENDFPPLFIVSVWLRPFFSSEPHKWIHSPKLKILQCGHWHSRLPLVRLTCLFSFNTIFYLGR